MSRVLIMLGVPHTGIEDQALRLAQAAGGVYLGDLQLSMVDKVGHLPMAEARDKVDRLISTFLLFGPLTQPRKQALTNRAISHPLVNAMPAGIK